MFTLFFGQNSIFYPVYSRGCYLSERTENTMNNRNQELIQALKAFIAVSNRFVSNLNKAYQAGCFSLSEEDLVELNGVLITNVITCRKLVLKLNELQPRPSDFAEKYLS